MIGPNPYKIVYELIRHDDAIYGSHTILARSEIPGNVWLDHYGQLHDGVDPDRLQIYRTEINGYGVVMGRERIKP